MQKVVWTETEVTPDSPQPLKLAQPQAKQNYYRDIAVLAFAGVIAAPLVHRFLHRLHADEEQGR